MGTQMSDEHINYVIARPWDEREPHNLCIYYLHGEIHRGTIEDATRTLERVQTANPGFDYSVYEVFYRKLS
jgi:hypothetical protein